MKKDYQKELNTLKNEMIEHLKSKAPINDINERVNVVIEGWDGEVLITTEINSINDRGEAETDTYNYDLNDILIEDLAWLCDNY